MKMTYFVEGIQGSGKSTLVKLLSEKCPDHKVHEEDGLVRHWTHRQDLELRICEELFWDRCTVLPSKLYGERDIRKLFG